MATSPRQGCTNWCTLPSGLEEGPPMGGKYRVSLGWLSPRPWPPALPPRTSAARTRRRARAMASTPALTPSLVVSTRKTWRGGTGPRGRPRIGAGAEDRIGRSGVAIRPLGAQNTISVSHQVRGNARARPLRRRRCAASSTYRQLRWRPCRAWSYTKPAICQSSRIEPRQRGARALRLRRKWSYHRAQ
jgi:hypothetical protein